MFDNLGKTNKKDNPTTIHHSQRKVDERVEMQGEEGETSWRISRKQESSSHKEGFKSKMGWRLLIPFEYSFY